MAQERPAFVWFDGKIVPYEDAKVHVSTATVLRGANIFEGVRAYWNGDERELYIFRNADHMARLWNSAKIMRMAVPWSADELTQAEIEVIRANKYQGTVWFRLTLYVGEEESPAAGGERIGGFIVTKSSPHTKGVADGVDSCISTWTRISDVSVPPRVKSGANYHNSRFAWTEAKLNGYNGSPIMLNERGKVS
jgi:branched-chain amino acid aminotransferase